MADEHLNPGDKLSDERHGSAFQTRPNSENRAACEEMKADVDRLADCWRRDAC